MISDLNALWARLSVMMGSIANALDNPKSTNVLGHTEIARLPPERIPQFLVAQRLQKRSAAHGVMSELTE